MTSRLSWVATILERRDCIKILRSIAFMTEFVINVAGNVVAVHAFFESSREYCLDYLCDEKPDFSITITEQDLAFERIKNAGSGSEEDVKVRIVPDAQLEITAIQRKLAEELLGHDVLLFHGSAVAVDGAAYLFTAKSGTGKSTHTRFWREMLGNRAVMVNDDKPFLRVTSEDISVGGSPWNGKHRLGSNINVPMKAICILERGTENKIERVTAEKALPMLLQQSNRPVNAAMLPKYMELLDAIASRVDFYRLQCKAEMEAAEVSFRAMSGGE